MEAFRAQGVDARMVVCEKLTDSPYIELAASSLKIKWSFLRERLKIFFANGFNRQTLFKIDTGDCGLPLWRIKTVKEADAVLINWVNQGMLSLNGVKKIQQLGNPVIITMHDMWWLTGVCHHAGLCHHYQHRCGNCPLLGGKASPSDISFKTWRKKSGIYSDNFLMSKTAFVPVSRWLLKRSKESSLLCNQRLEVIPNAFKLLKESDIKEVMPSRETSKQKIRILFGAARLDDPIKGLDTLKATAAVLKENYPEISSHLELAMFGNIKDPSLLEGFQLPLVKLGVLLGERTVAKAYLESDIVVSSSSYETLPGTLVEAQAYGCIPVSFNQGGQEDIIEDGVTGFIADYDESKDKRAHNLAKAIVKAGRVVSDQEHCDRMILKMKEEVERKFSYSEIAGRYIKLIESLHNGT